MKQVKYLNGFIYNSKYKSSWAILNTNPTPPKKKTNEKPPTLLIHKMTPPTLATITAFFPTKTGDRLKIVIPIFPARVAKGKSHLWVV